MELGTIKYFPWLNVPHSGKVYVDLDGVQFDFFKKLAELYGKPHWKDIPKEEDTFKRLQGTDFFATLPRFDSTERFLKMVNKYSKGNFSILSSPLRGDEENSSKHKDTAVDRLFYDVFGEGFDKRRIYEHDKWKYSIDAITGKPNILIDDAPHQLKAWREKGGIGIRYQANESKFEKFEQKLKDLFQPLATKELHHG
tara:strand:- start:179 stop:769 length:591 start_codon:yes stop_codon:yes gene_type:complete